MIREGPRCRRCGSRRPSGRRRRPTARRRRCARRCRRPGLHRLRPPAPAGRAGALPAIAVRREPRRLYRGPPWLLSGRCRLHGNLPGTLVAFRDRSTAAPLPSRCDDVGETLGGPGGPLPRSPIRSRQATARTGCGWPGWERRRAGRAGTAEQAVNAEGLGHVVLGGQRPHQVPVPALAQRGQPGQLPRARTAAASSVPPSPSAAAA